MGKLFKGMNAGIDFSSSDTSIDSVYNFAPTAVQTTELEGIFDFVIRAEDVGSKPDKRVYKAAVAA